jgi:predicted nucleotidyltransferase
MTDSLSTYRETMRRREARARRAQELRRQKARATARRVARFLRDEYGASRVVLFGSMARGGRLGPRSDVDLAVWGLDAEDYYEAVGRVQDVDGNARVDLVRMEDASDSLRKEVRREGGELPIHE